MSANLMVSEQLAHSTARIQCKLSNGKDSVGTGFFFSFANDGQSHVVAIVTNRHVVKDAVTGTFSLTKRSEDGGPLVGNHMTITFSNFEALWIGHPNPDVDLCVMPISTLLMETQKEGLDFFFVTLDKNWIPTDEVLNNLSALEDIVMVGYPVGLWDSTNNMPILRRGVTATHANIDYEGRKEFLIDAACFPGSSGSPVFLFNMGGWFNRDGTSIIGGGIRVGLLRVLYAGPQYTATGEIKVVTIPTSQQQAIALSQIPTNLGIIIKASRLNELDALLRANLNSGAQVSQNP
jgi:hypothetical protein